MYDFKTMNKEHYKGYQATFTYETKYYYDVIVNDMGFNLVLKEFESLVSKSFVDTLFEDFLVHPHAIGIFNGEELVGFAEGNYEAWHQSYRITNIFVEKKYRRQGYGELLMNELMSRANKMHDLRAFVLETQSCNYPAISFYKKMGFSLIGLDTIAYTNSDVKNKEVRLEFGKKKLT